MLTNKNTLATQQDIVNARMCLSVCLCVCVCICMHVIPEEHNQSADCGPKIRVARDVPSKLDVGKQRHADDGVPKNKDQKHKKASHDG
jgi:hypothetical protein